MKILDENENISLEGENIPTIPEVTSNIKNYVHTQNSSAYSRKSLGMS